MHETRGKGERLRTWDERALLIHAINSKSPDAVTQVVKSTEGGAHVCW